MRLIFEEYGKYAIAAIAVLIAVIFFAYNVVSPTGKLHYFVEQAIDNYLASDTQTSYDETKAVASDTPLEFQVISTCKINTPTNLTSIFQTTDGSTLQYIRVLNTDETWSVSDQSITFTQPGIFELRIYGENTIGKFGTATFWVGVNRV